MSILKGLLWVLDCIVVAYFLMYAGTNLLLLVISAFKVRRDLLLSQIFHDRAKTVEGDASFAPLISLLVPAYNEEVTIVESVRSLLRLRYPHYEIVMVNDGSKDTTVEVLKKAFEMVRSDVDYNPQLGAMPIRGFYRAGIELPPSVTRLVLVDKENGGKADAINAGINCSQGTYVATMDADSLMIDQALIETVQPILDDPNGVVASGGQIALSNGCKVEGGRVTEVHLPKKWIARFQVVEYMRSFTQSRTALGELNSLLILSGVFAIFQRASVIASGGFLTKHMRSRIGQEYCGVGAETVCEDMEIVVRLHRYLMDHGSSGRVVFLPFPTSWTEAPEIWQSLGKQRNRWYRGLLEVLWYHRKMMLRPRYGRIGLFALPYQLFFEAAAPVIEMLGYFMLPLSWLTGLLSAQALLAFMGLALAFNLFLSAGSVMVSIMRVRLRKTSTQEVALFGYRGAKSVLIMVFAGLISNLGYRQYLLYWQIKGLRDFLAGRKSWDKFARQGFGPQPAK
ncbi:MAG: glycosyltransferase family 2 protein [Deltaproteobacteria bacterium]|nr:glycosyltransferase family 2 protein [Deltaproteobacteria bacterium]